MYINILWKFFWGWRIFKGSQEHLMVQLATKSLRFITPVVLQEKLYAIHSAAFYIRPVLLDWKPCGGRNNESCDGLAPVFTHHTKEEVLSSTSTTRFIHCWIFLLNIYSTNGGNRALFTSQNGGIKTKSSKPTAYIDSVCCIVNQNNVSKMGLTLHVSH